MRTRARGQAILEMALVSPMLVVLLMGGIQVGQIAYSQVSVDTAAREGARAGAAAPNAALAWDSGGAVPASHQCTTTDFTEGSSSNPVCIAVLNADGLLSSSTFTANPCASGQGCVTVQVEGAANLSAFRTTQHAVLMSSGGSPCNSGRQATVTGTVSNIPTGSTASVTDTSGDTQSGITGSFTLCVAASGNASSQTLVAQVGTLSCGGYSGAVGPFSVRHGTTYTEDLSVTAEPVCPTPTPTPTATPTPTP
ncbi:MAG TPA: TadE family protein, partial [Candidatus Dormibacteraeota bacterium]|nr:TadE family protein [Candidatus Dormibacteraeota bacterium]